MEFQNLDQANIQVLGTTTGTGTVTANSATNIAQLASNNANTKLSITGGEITGNLIVDGTFSNQNNTIDAGSF